MLPAVSPVGWIIAPTGSGGDSTTSSHFWVQSGEPEAGIKLSAGCSLRCDAGSSESLGVSSVTVDSGLIATLSVSTSPSFSMVRKCALFSDMLIEPGSGRVLPVSLTPAYTDK